MLAIKSDEKPTTLTDRTIGPSNQNQGVVTNLDQLDDVLKIYISDPACAAVLSAAESLRSAATFVDASTAKVGEILRKHRDAVETASEVAQAAVPLHGHHSPNERVVAVAAAGETIAQAFWRKAVSEVVAARQKKADALADDCIVSIEAAKLKIAGAHAQVALPLTMRMKIGADDKALIDQLAIELANDKPSAIEALVKTFQAVHDEDRATLVLMAVTPMILDYHSKPQSLARFRPSGNVEVEAAAAGRLKQLIDTSRRAEIPQSLYEAEAGYKRLFPIFGSIFSRRVTPEDLRATPNWLEVALGKASTFKPGAAR